MFMRNAGHLFRVFITIVKHIYRAKFEYPGSLMGGIIAQWLTFGTSMAMVFLMVWNFGSLAGWEPAEVVFINAIQLIAYAVGATFSFNLYRSFSEIAINGTLDEAYIRPMPPFLYLIATNYNIGYIAHFTISAVALGISISHLGLSWSVFQWIWLVVLIISGATITACLMLTTGMPAIRTRSRSPLTMFFWQGREFTQYPITIYPRAVVILFTTMLPFAFVNFYPVQVLLGKEDGIMPRLTMWLSPLVAILLIGVTALCWRILSSKYESAGT